MNVIYLFSHINYVIFDTVVLDNVPLHIHCMHVHLYWFEYFLLIYILVLKNVKQYHSILKKQNLGSSSIFCDTRDHINPIWGDKFLSYFFSEILKISFGGMCSDCRRQGNYHWHHPVANVYYLHIWRIMDPDAPEYYRRLLFK